MKPFPAPTAIAAALALLSALFAGTAAAQAVATDRAACERAYKPYSGPEGKDVVWVPTPDEGHGNPRE